MQAYYRRDLVQAIGITLPIVGGGMTTYILKLFSISFTPRIKPAWLNGILDTPLSWGRGEKVS